MLLIFIFFYSSSRLNIYINNPNINNKKKNQKKSKLIGTYKGKIEKTIQCKLKTDRN